MAMQANEEDNICRKKKFVIEDEDIDEEALAKSAIAELTLKQSQSQKNEDQDLEVEEKQRSQNIPMDPKSPLLHKTSSASNNNHNEKSTPNINSPASKVKPHAHSSTPKMKTPTKPSANKQSNIKTPLSKSSSNKISKEKVTPKKKIEEDEDEDEESYEGEDSSEEESESSSESSSSSSSEGEGSSSESKNPNDPKTIFMKQVAEIKKMNISIEEKKELIREKIRERKKREIQLKIDLLKKKKNASLKQKENRKEHIRKREEKRHHKKSNNKREKVKREGSGSSKKSKQSSQQTADKSTKYFCIKENLVSEVGARWWYALPEWPPKNYDYQPKLKESKLRKVNPERFNFESEYDSNGNLKVCEVDHYPGIFQDSKGKLYDLRPMENCPSINNLMKKDVKELQQLAYKAMQEQLKILEPEDGSGCRACEVKVVQELKDSMNKIHKFLA